MRVQMAVLVSALVVACSGTARHVEPPPPPPPPPSEAPPEPEPEPEPTLAVAEDVAAPEGPSCVRTTECAAGLACRGAPGCGTAWACGAAREACGPEIVSYCDCDGVTFHAPAGCPERTYAHVGPCEEPGVADASYGLPDGDEPITQRDRTCSSSADCRGGEICYGPPGCGMPWRCERARGCARGGRADFCGCDGATFRAQRHCPGQPFARLGSCDEVVASAEPTPTPTATTTTTTATTTATAPLTTTTTTTTTTTATTATATTTGIPPAQGTCRTNRDCRRGEVCAGPAGCGDPWTCVRRTERCNPDTQYFCDCEGETFTASMTCPSRPYVHRGSCAIDQVIDLAGAALR